MAQTFQNFTPTDSGSGLFPNGFEYISTSRDFQASDAGKLLFLESNVILTMPPLTPFSEHDIVGIMASDSGVSFNTEPGGPIISFAGDEVAGEIVLLTNEIIEGDIYLLPISTNIIDDNGVRKTSIRYLYDKVQNAIPLTGTEVGKPVTGDIQISNNDNPINFYSGDLNGNAKGFQTWTDDNSFKLFSITGGIEDASMQIGTLGISISASDSLAVGLTGQQDYTANITDLDYTQKIYVDTKASKLGADDIEITDFNKGVILTSPNGSRYRITVDDSGTLITTLIS